MSAKEGITKDDFIGLFKAIHARVEENQEYLSRLDTEIGDGDHGFSMASGFKSLNEKLEEYSSLSIGELLKKGGFELIKTIGGASGAVFGTFFTGQGAYYEKNLNNKETLSLKDLTAMLDEALQQIKKRGNAEPGDKTMVDAMYPAVEGLKKACEKELTFSRAFDIAAEKAYQGAEKTKDMVAKRGRSKNLGDRSKGYVDPGAVSTSLIFRAMADYFSEKHL